MEATKVGQEGIHMIGRLYDFFNNIYITDPATSEYRNLVTNQRQSMQWKTVCGNEQLW